MKKFYSFNAYEKWADAHPETFMYQPVCLVEHGIVRMDCTYKCKSFKTAIRRFAKDFASVQEADGWGKTMLESCESGYFIYDSMVDEGYSYRVENVGDRDYNAWYISLNINNKLF